MCLAGFILSTTNFLFSNSQGGLSLYVVRHFYSKTVCKYISEQSVESKDLVVRWIDKKELGLVSYIAKKLGFWSPSSKLTCTLPVQSGYRFFPCVKEQSLLPNYASPVSWRRKRLIKLPKHWEKLLWYLVNSLLQRFGFLTAFWKRGLEIDISFEINAN